MMRSTYWLAAACAALGMAAQPAAAQPAHLILVDSPTMSAGATMPRDYTPDGRNLSPPLRWSNLPEGTRELAVVCADFGAGNPPPWVHWIIYSIPATATGLPAGLPIQPATAMPRELTGAIQGHNGWRRPYYRGPAPPAGTPHLYHFTVYALDQALGLEPGLTRHELLEAMEGHIIGRGDIVPVYERF
jgi:Raf kinase inhibitor-like YbhB/YbcL family protein